MVDSVVTVRDVFDLPQPGSSEESSPRWQSLRQWINEDLAVAKSPAMEDVGATIEELLHIPVSDIFVKSWKETDAIKVLLAESRKSPEAVTNVELADHTIKSKHHPHIEVRRKKATSKKIEFTLRLLFKLQGFSLRIQNGNITEMLTGPCEMQGTLEYQGLAVVEQKNGPINLPQVIAFNEGQKVEVKEPEPVNIATLAAAHEPLVQPKHSEPAPPPSQIAPKVVAPAAPPKVEAEVIEPPKAPSLSAPESVETSPDFASLVPPYKITPQSAPTESTSKVSDSPPDVTPTEEEEREVFVL